MNTSTEINELAKALAAAQGEFPRIEKRKMASVKGVAKASGKEYSINYAYADIADVIAAITPVLSKHGISFIQPTIITDSGMFVVTRLMHSSGQWIESEYPVCGISGDHQKMGGALTYARRYSLCSMSGVAADDDIDGEGAAHPPMKKDQPKRADQPRQSSDDFPGDSPRSAPPDNAERQKYMRDAIDIIDGWTSNVAGLKSWWEGESHHREEFGIFNPSPDYAELFEAFKQKGLSLKSSPQRAA